MKRHKSFDAYFKAQNYNVTNKIKLLMMDVWTNARYGYIDTQPENKNFEEWYDSTNIKSDKLDAAFVSMMKEFMHRAWDAAVKNE